MVLSVSTCLYVVGVCPYLPLCPVSLLWTPTSPYVAGPNTLHTHIVCIDISCFICLLDIDAAASLRELLQSIHQMKDELTSLQTADNEQRLAAARAEANEVLRLLREAGVMSEDSEQQQKEQLQQQKQLRQTAMDRREIRVVGGSSKRLRK